MEDCLRNPPERSVHKYLESLEKLVISQSGEELLRIKINQAAQEKNEILTIWDARIKTLFKLAFLDMANKMDSNVTIRDQFINVIVSKDQKRYILE